MFSYRDVYLYSLHIGEWEAPTHVGSSNFTRRLSLDRTRQLGQPNLETENQQLPRILPSSLERGLKHYGETFHSCRTHLSSHRRRGWSEFARAQLPTSINHIERQIRYLHITTPNLQRNATYRCRRWTLSTQLRDSMLSILPPTERVGVMKSTTLKKQPKLHRQNGALRSCRIPDIQPCHRRRGIFHGQCSIASRNIRAARNRHKLRGRYVEQNPSHQLTLRETINLTQEPSRLPKDHSPINRTNS